MKKISFIALIIIFLSSAVIARGEEFPIICELKEVLNFKSPTQVIYLKIDMEKHTVNGIPSKVFGNDIITYETTLEILTIALPSMYITVERKGRGIDGSNVKYTGVCYRDKINF